MAIHIDDGDQLNLIIIGAYIVGILLLWCTPVLKHILYPFKLVTIIFHELGHAIMAKCTGGSVKSLTVEPELGGLTVYTGGKSKVALPAGYLGSSLIGSLMVFCGFDLLASKIMSIFIMLMLLLALYWAKNWLTRIMTILFCVLIGFLWWPFNAEGLKYVVLFMGVMSALYSVWDILEDLVLHRTNESDAAKFAKECGCCPARGWGIIWFFISLGFLAGSIVLGIVVF